jgi:hypothetical protein
MERRFPETFTAFNQVQVQKIFFNSNEFQMDLAPLQSKIHSFFFGKGKCGGKKFTWQRSFSSPNYSMQN